MKTITKTYGTRALSWMRWGMMIAITSLVAFSCVGGAAVKKSPADFNDVAGKEWELIEVRTALGPTEFNRAALEAAEMGDAYTLRFDGERLAGKGAPNRYTAPYQLGEGDAISIQPIAGTLMASFQEPPGLGEREYYNYLEKVSRWGLAQEVLHLYTQNSAGEEAVLAFKSR
jgi:heat shock protein HslJ